MSTRWAAPELLLPPLIHQDQPQRSRATDVWAFGMMCLELMTDSEPYAYLKYDAQVIHQVADKHGPILPDRPGEPAISRGLSDELWLIMRNCWQSDPYARPPMSQVKILIDGLLANLQPHVVGKLLHSSFNDCDLTGVWQHRQGQPV
jgi:serine/threonine protein kinase